MALESSGRTWIADNETKGDRVGKHVGDTGAGRESLDVKGIRIDVVRQSRRTATCHDAEAAQRRDSSKRLKGAPSRHLLQRADIYPRCGANALLANTYLYEVHTCSPQCVCVRI